MQLTFAVFLCLRRCGGGWHGKLGGVGGSDSAVPGKTAEERPTETELLWEGERERERERESDAVSTLGPEPGSNPVRSRPHLLHVLINPDSIRIQRNHIRLSVEVSSTRIQRWAWYLSHDYCRRHAQT